MIVKRPRKTSTNVEGNSLFDVQAPRAVRGLYHQSVHLRGEVQSAPRSRRTNEIETNISRRLGRSLDETFGQASDESEGSGTKSF